MQLQVNNSLSTFFQIVKRINMHVMLTWAWRVEERRRSECGSQRWPGPAGFGSCRGAGPWCSSSAWSPPAPRPPPAAPPAGSAAPAADCGPSAPSASAAAQLPPPAKGFITIYDPWFYFSGVTHQFKFCSAVFVFNDVLRLVKHIRKVRDAQVTHAATNDLKRHTVRRVHLHQPFLLDQAISSMQWTPQWVAPLRCVRLHTVPDNHSQNRQRRTVATKASAGDFNILNHDLLPFS